MTEQVQTLTGLYRDRATAEAIIRRLVEAGIADDAVRILPRTAEGSAAPSEAALRIELQDASVAEEVRPAYLNAIASGLTLVAAVVDDRRLIRASDIMDRNAVSANEAGPATPGAAPDLRTSGNSAAYAFRAPVSAVGASADER